MVSECTTYVQKLHYKELLPLQIDACYDHSQPQTAVNLKHTVRSKERERLQSHHQASTRAQSSEQLMCESYKTTEQELG